MARHADDLKFLTDEFESMAFRRRGYERDALLQAVIDRSGFKDLVESEEAERGVLNPWSKAAQEAARDAHVSRVATEAKGGSSTATEEEQKSQKKERDKERRRARKEPRQAAAS